MVSNIRQLYAGMPCPAEKVFEVHSLSEDDTVALSASLDTGEFIRVFPSVEIVRLVNCRHLAKLPPNTRFPLSLRDVYITGTRIQELPDLSYLTNLEVADFRDNHVEQLFSAHNSFNANVRTIDLSYNKIHVISDYAVFPGESIVDLSFNFLTVPSPDAMRFSTHHNEIPPREAVRSILYAFDSATETWVSPRTGATMPPVQNFLPMSLYPHVYPHDVPRPTINVYQGSQNVHNSSVQKSSSDAICAIMNMAKELERTRRTNALTGMSLVRAVNTIFYKKVLFIFKWPIKFASTPNLHDWVINCTSVHSRMNVTFEELLGAVWAVIETHSFRDTLRERLAEELRDAMGLCFTGRMTRVINSLQGLVDGIRIVVSPRERLQAAAAQIVKRKATTKDVDALQHELVGVIDDVPDITQSERDAWIDAFNDA